jgi:hypothetical protein
MDGQLTIRENQRRIEPRYVAGPLTLGSVDPTIADGGAVRRDSKPEIDMPRKASFANAGSADPSTGWIVKLSVVGVEIESLQPPEASSEVVVRTELVPGEGEVVLRGRVQWVKPTRFAVQFGPLGVRETSAIVKASRRAVA